MTNLRNRLLADSGRRDCVRELSAHPRGLTLSIYRRWNYHLGRPWRLPVEGSLDLTRGGKRWLGRPFRSASDWRVSKVYSDAPGGMVQ